MCTTVLNDVHILWCFHGKTESGVFDVQQQVSLFHTHTHTHTHTRAERVLLTHTHTHTHTHTLTHTHKRAEDEYKHDAQSLS